MENAPKSIGIVLDGNRRFAKRLMLKPWKGHEWGAKKIHELLGWCNEIGVEEVTLYAFSIENFDRVLIDEMINKSNELIKKDLAVEVYYKPKEEALNDPNMIKLANALPPDVENLRVVDIKGFDYQADGGCHVKSLKSIGKIVFIKADNKGKSNRRVYFTLI